MGDHERETDGDQTAEQAKEDGIHAAEAQIAIQRLTRSRIHGVDSAGAFGILVDQRRQILLGAWAVGPLASERIGSSVLAIKVRIPLATLCETPAQFPTFGEALGKAPAELG